MDAKFHEPLTRAAANERIAALDAYLALNAPAPRALRRHRDDIVLGMLWLDAFIKREGSYPTGEQFAAETGLTRNQALTRLRRVRNLQKPGMPWCDKSDSNTLEGCDTFDSDTLAACDTSDSGTPGECDKSDSGRG
jgi:hypothetical protein